MMVLVSSGKIKIIAHPRIAAFGNNRISNFFALLFDTFAPNYIHVAQGGD